MLFRNPQMKIEAGDFVISSRFARLHQPIVEPSLVIETKENLALVVLKEDVYWFEISNLQKVILAKGNYE